VSLPDLTDPSTEPAVGKLTDDSPPSLGDDPEQVLRRSSPGRFLLRVLVGLALVAALGAGGYFGFRALEAHRARNAASIPFDATTATIGNDLFETERPAHEATVAAFALDKTEVTVSAYRTCFEQGGCTEPAKGAFCNLGQGPAGAGELKGDRDAHPINCVTHAQAAAFCAWAGKRLPTERE